MQRNMGQCPNPQATDYGPEPFVVNIDSATRQNGYFRLALWTGQYLQLTLMCIRDEIGLEIHPDTDQFIRVEEGCGLVMMGKNENNLNYQARIGKDSAVFVPAGTWHNIINCGNCPLKVYTIYAPPHHPRGTTHCTREDAEAAEAAEKQKPTKIQPARTPTKSEAVSPETTGKSEVAGKSEVSGKTEVSPSETEDTGMTKLPGKPES